MPLKTSKHDAFPNARNETLMDSIVYSGQIRLMDIKIISSFVQICDSTTNIVHAISG